LVTITAHPTTIARVLRPNRSVLVPRRKLCSGQRWTWCLCGE